MSLEARTKIVRDKAQFEGRFFVKILRDANIESNIVQPQALKEDKYQILLSKRIRYICAAHPGLQDWSKKIIDNTGAFVGASPHAKNFIPVAINHRGGDLDRYGQWANHQTGTRSGINSHAPYGNGAGQPEGVLATRLVSSPG